MTGPQDALDEAIREAERHIERQREVLANLELAEHLRIPAEKLLLEMEAVLEARKAFRTRVEALQHDK
ncbi:MAG TPA: hypothetical protein VHV26_04025 [Rhizomicrobium sp.]|jgi:hypothetical protein|nr:hypothetical protein [Rhizomicrobium sp.]